MGLKKGNWNPQESPTKIQHSHYKIFLTKHIDKQKQEDSTNWFITS